jgi:cyclopropane fatty-acyl-phospholipid synthase-like methyltransferase
MTEVENRWEMVYRNSDIISLPWFLGELDIDLEEETSFIFPGSFLDIGTGPGTQAIELARRGFSVTGIDVSISAIQKAKLLSKNVKFIQDDILHTKLKGKFDYIVDRGCFHTISPEMRQQYVKNVNSLLKFGGQYFLKCFSKEEKRMDGPYTFSEEEIRNIFGEAFSIEKIKETEFVGQLTPYPKALFVVARKIAI